MGTFPSQPIFEQESICHVTQCDISIQLWGAHLTQRTAQRLTMRNQKMITVNNYWGDILLDGNPLLSLLHIYTFLFFFQCCVISFFPFAWDAFLCVMRIAYRLTSLKVYPLAVMFGNPWISSCTWLAHEARNNNANFLTSEGKFETIFCPESHTKHCSLCFYFLCRSYVTVLSKLVSMPVKAAYVCIAKKIIIIWTCDKWTQYGG